MAKYKVGYFVGSLSSKSINRLLAKALVRLAPPDLEMVEIPIKDLPLYSQEPGDLFGSGTLSAPSPRRRDRCWS